MAVPSDRAQQAAGHREHTLGACTRLDSRRTYALTYRKGTRRHPSATTDDHANYKLTSKEIQRPMTMQSSHGIAPRFFARGNRGGRCRWSAGFLGNLPFPPTLAFPCCSILTSLHPDRLSRPRWTRLRSTWHSCEETQEEITARRSVVASTTIAGWRNRRNCETWVALKNEVLRADEGEMSREQSSAGIQGREKRQIPEKTLRPAASSGVVPTHENSGVPPVGTRTRCAPMGGEQSNRSANLAGLSNMSQEPDDGAEGGATYRIVVPIEDARKALGIIQHYCTGRGIVPDDAVGRRVFSGISRFPRPPSFRCRPIFTSITLIGSQDLAVKSRPNLFTHSLLQIFMAYTFEPVHRFEVKGHSNKLYLRILLLVTRRFHGFIRPLCIPTSSSAYWSLSCVFIGCCPVPGRYGIRKVLPCKSAIGSEACRAGLINCDPIAKAIDSKLQCQTASPDFVIIGFSGSPPIMVANLKTYSPRKSSVYRELGSQDLAVMSRPNLYLLYLYAIHAKVSTFQRHLILRGGHGGRVVSLLASHQGDPGSIPGRITPDFRMWESCRTMPLVGGSSRGSPVSPALSFRRSLLHTHLNHPHRLSRPRFKINDKDQNTIYLLTFKSALFTENSQYIGFSWYAPLKVEQKNVFFFLLNIRDNTWKGTMTPRTVISNAYPTQHLKTVMAAVAERLASSPPTKANRVQSPAGSRDFRKWESCWTMPSVGGFSRGSPVSPRPFIPVPLHINFNYTHRLSRPRCYEPPKSLHSLTSPQIEFQNFPLPACSHGCRNKRCHAMTSLKLHFRPSPYCDTQNLEKVETAYRQGHDLPVAIESAMSVLESCIDICAAEICLICPKLSQMLKSWNFRVPRRKRLGAWYDTLKTGMYAKKLVRLTPIVPPWGACDLEADTRLRVLIGRARTDADWLYVHLGRSHKSDEALGVHVSVACISLPRFLTLNAQPHSHLQERFRD
ncbi:hypothetical protein PR048_024445, partial [Dryococelus australis]